MSTPSLLLGHTSVPGKSPLPITSAAPQLSVGSRHARELPRSSGWLSCLVGLCAVARWVAERLVRGTWWAKPEVAEAEPPVLLATG